MSKTARVSKIVLEIGDKIIELTPEQAKELEKILGDMFGDKDVIFVHGYPYTYTYPIWTTTISNDPSVSSGNYTVSLRAM